MTATLAALALLALAADPAWLASPPLSAEPAALAREAAALTPPEGGDIDVLLEEAVVALDEQGRATTTYRLVYRALTREGAERWSEVARAWAPWHQDRPEIRARVIGRDGAVHQLDPASLVEAGLGDQEEGLYSDRRILKGPLPAVDAGAVVEEVETVRDLAPLFEPGQVRRFFVGRDGPVRTVRLRLEAPRGLPLAWALRGGLAGAPRESTEGGRRVVAWQWGPLAARPRPEPLQPPEAASAPHVAFGTGRTWKAVAAAYAAVVERQLAGEDLSAVAAEVVPRGASREAAVQAVLDWQRQRVRYTGLELGEAALVPARPGEALRRRYGDCKDLSLLVAGVLRAAGFPATLALVRADGDAPADLPGLGEFDHAVVAVDGAGGAAPLFVDPTDGVTPAGELPAMLQGRLALVAWPSSSGLVRLPERPADRNRVEVVREIRLAESGWCDASEVQELTGWPATDQRAALLRLGPGERADRDHELVTSHFVQSSGGQVAFQGLERPGTPVRMTLSGTGSHWGVTRSDDAEAVVSAAYLLQWLPPPVRPRPTQEEGEPAAKRREAAEAPRRTELQLPIAYQGTLRYRVVPPPGFEPELPLPEPRRHSLGPLTVTSRAAVEADGAVGVVHELAVGRRRLSADEVETLRQGLGPLLADEPRLRFTRTSSRLLEAGQGREALDELRRVIALHPDEARHWNHLAQALLRLGMGEAARAAARRAVALEPSSSWSHRVLATTLEHDALGRWLVPGCDLSGAVAAQRRAVELDRDPAVRAHLAFLLEHGEGCERFGEGARLDEAAAAYRFIRVELKSKEHDRDHLLVLLRAGRFADAAPLAADLAPADRRVAQLAIRAATEGVELAVADALKIPSGERAAALEQASQHLVLARRYPEAARLLDGAAAGTPQSAQLRARSAVLARVVRVETMKLAPGDPATLPVRLLRAMAEGGEAWKAVPELTEPSRGVFTEAAGASFRRALRAAAGLPDRVALDAALSLLEVRTEGDPARALRLVASSPSVPTPLVFAMVKERGAWRLVTTDPPTPGLGAAARRLAEAGDAAGARAALALAREGAGEAAEGRAAGALQVLAPEGQELGLPALRLAGAALESYAAPEEVRPLLVKARAEAAPPARQALGWALAAGLVRQDRWAELLPLVDELQAAAPTSERAFNLRVAALLELGQAGALAQAIAQRLAALPGDDAALRARLSLSIRDGDVAAALAQERAIVASGKAAAGDHNNLAWAMIFQPPIDAAALEQARRAVELSREREAAYLHTLATVHAVRGEAAEAMQVLRRAVERGSADNRPSPHDWLVLGMVAERYGLVEEATAAYRRVTAPERPDGLSSHELARRRLTALGAKP
jgi:Flp pilus assembly protein TadD